jgi:2-aminoadipate transaminase
VETVSFSGDGIGPELVPSEELADCAATVLAADGKRILSYGTGAGYTPLRELIAEWFGVHPFRVLVTNGWLQGFALLVQARGRNANVVVEFPTYDRAVRMLFAAGANLQYIDLHPEGAALDGLEYQLRATQPTPAFLYTIPTFHNPTGQTLTAEERQTYWTLANRFGTVMLEDDSYGLLRFEGERLPTLFDYSAQRSVYSTSFSNLIAPGLRVGFFILPDDLAVELAALATASFISPALLGQATVFELLRRGSFEPHLEQLKSELRKRRDTLLASLEQHLPDCTWSKPEGGLFVTLRLPPGTVAAEAITAAEGVSADAGSDVGGPPNALRLNFGAPALEQIEPGIERVAAAIRRHAV